MERSERHLNSLMTKLANIHKNTESSHLSPSPAPVIHTKSWSSRCMNSPSHPSVWPPLLRAASWFRPAVAALAASGADPPHYNASDIYLGRTTGRTGGGGRRQTTPVDVDSSVANSAHCTPTTTTPTLSSLLCFAHASRMFVSSLWELNGNTSALRFQMSHTAAIRAAGPSNKWDVASISSHMNEIKGPARCPHDGCSSPFHGALHGVCWDDEIIDYRVYWCSFTIQSSRRYKNKVHSSLFSHISLSYTFTPTANKLW